MQTDQPPEESTGLLQTLTGAVSELKQRLQHDYEQAYPGLGDIIRIVLDEEEANAWGLSFPHLFLPDLVEAHIATLGLQPADTRHDDILTPHDFTQIENYQPALAYAAC
ncbi:MAG: hypothetical protein QOH24_712 [Verrucomicrobiota bacterium]